MRFASRFSQTRSNRPQQVVQTKALQAKALAGLSLFASGSADLVALLLDRGSRLGDRAQAPEARVGPERALRPVLLDLNQRVKLAAEGGDTLKELSVLRANITSLPVLKPVGRTLASM